MAERFSVEEVINEVFKDGSSANGTDLAEGESDDCEKSIDKRLAELLAKFDGGKNFNKAVFVKTAEEMLLPLANVCQLKESDPNVVSLTQTLLSSSVNAAVIFRSESLLWLQRIHRRLAGKRSIRRPYYCEICREMPVELFNILARSLN
ncbi:Hypothetical predicted protein, partial [Paramuricea clavata]